MRKTSLYTVFGLVQASPSWWDLRHLDHQGVPPRRADKFHLVSDQLSAFLKRTNTMETVKKVVARPVCDSSISWVLESVWRAGGLAFCSWSHPNECDNLMWRSVGKSDNVVAMQTTFATAARHSSCPPLIFPSSFRGQYLRWWSTSPSCDCKLSSERAAISLFRHPRQLCAACPPTRKRRRTTGGIRGHHLHVQSTIFSERSNRYLGSIDRSIRNIFQYTNCSVLFPLIPAGSDESSHSSDVRSLTSDYRRTSIIDWRVWTREKGCSRSQFFLSWIRTSRRKSSSIRRWS